MGSDVENRKYNEREDVGKVRKQGVFMQKIYQVKRTH